MPTQGSGQSAPAIRNIEGDPEALRAVGVDTPQLQGRPVVPQMPPKPLLEQDFEAVERLKQGGYLDLALDKVAYPRAERAEPQAPPLTLKEHARNNAEPVLVVPLPDGLVAEIFVRGGRHQPKHFAALARFLLSIGEMEHDSQKAKGNGTPKRSRPRPADSP